MKQYRRSCGLRILIIVQVQSTIRPRTYEMSTRRGRASPRPAEGDDAKSRDGCAIRHEFEVLLLTSSLERLTYFLPVLTMLACLWTLDLRLAYLYLPPETCLEVEDHSFLRRLLKEDGFSSNCYWLSDIAEFAIFGLQPKVAAYFEIWLIMAKQFVFNKNGWIVETWIN
jgi:hypothetical protein